VEGVLEAVLDAGELAQQVGPHVKGVQPGEHRAGDLWCACVRACVSVWARVYVYGPARGKNVCMCTCAMMLCACKALMHNAHHNLQ